VTCDNTESNTTIDVTDSFLWGDIDLLQQCNVNGQCYSSSTSDATADVKFKANQTTAATNFGEICIFCDQISDNSSLQDIQQVINQYTDEQCKIASVNDLQNVDIYIDNSSVWGDIKIAQSGATQGGCTMSNNMTAAAYATGSVAQHATTGKDKKQSKLGTGILYYVGIIAAVIILIIIAFFVAKFLINRYGTNKPSTTQAVKIATE